MTKRFVLDTNTLISAQLSNSSVSRKAYLKAFELGLVVCSEPTFSEFESKFLMEKFGYIPLSLRKQAISRIKSRCLIVPVTVSIKACRDPKDDMFLELAVSAKADCLVTGDKALLDLHPFRGIPIVTSRQFIDMF